jgi:hypothetical protein
LISNYKIEDNIGETHQLISVSLKISTVPAIENAIKNAFDVRITSLSIPLKKHLMPLIL